MTNHPNRSTDPFRFSTGAYITDWKTGGEPREAAMRDDAERKAAEAAERVLKAMNVTAAQAFEAASLTNDSFKSNGYSMTTEGVLYHALAYRAAEAAAAEAVKGEIPDHSFVSLGSR